MFTSRVPDISSARLNFINDESIVKSTSLTPCSGAMVGIVTFPLGSFSYQLEGKDKHGNYFVHNSKRTHKFNPGNYDYLLTPSNPQEIRPGESVVLEVELYNHNIYGFTEYTLSTESPNGLSIYLQQTHVFLEARNSTKLSVNVTANAVLPGSSHWIILRDECNIELSIPLTLTVIELEFVVVTTTQSNVTCPDVGTTTDPSLSNPPAC